MRYIYICIYIFRFPPKKPEDLGLGLFFQNFPKNHQVILFQMDDFIAPARDCHASEPSVWMPRLIGVVMAGFTQLSTKL